MRNIESKPGRESVISKVLGATPEEEQEILEKFRNDFEHPDLAQKLHIIEKEKTPEEIEIIESINAHMGEFLKEYGGQPIKITPEKIIFLDENKLTNELLEKYSFGKDPTAITYPIKQLIVVIPPYPENYPKVKLDIARILVHEALHFNSFASVSRQKGKLESRQMGIAIEFPKQRFLEDLNEAIIEKMAMKFAERYFSQISPLEKDMRKREQAINEFPEDMQENAREIISSIFTKQLPSGEYKIMIKAHTIYEKERMGLKYILDTIHSKNPTEFSSPEDVFKIFASATLSGDLPNIARLIEQNLGKGSFKKVAQVFSKPHIKPSETQ